MSRAVGRRPVCRVDLEVVRDAAVDSAGLRRRHARDPVRSVGLPVDCDVEPAVHADSHGRNVFERAGKSLLGGLAGEEDLVDDQPGAGGRHHGETGVTGQFEPPEVASDGY